MSVGRRYVPESGDVVWLQFDPQTGHEQAGHRPALVISPSSYNGRSGLMLCCPITTRIKGYPFEVELAGEPPSAVLSDQVKSADWIARRARFRNRATPRELAEVKSRVRALIA